MSEFDRFVEFFNHGQMDLTHWLAGLFIILALAIAIVTIVGKLSSILGKPVAWVRKADEQRKQVEQLQTKVQQLQKKQEQDRQASIQHDEKIQKRQQEIYDLLIDMKITNQRWQVISCANHISDGKKVSKEELSHVIDVYTDYQELLKRLGKTNGKVDASMDVIRKKYEQGLQNGFE